MKNSYYKLLSLPYKKGIVFRIIFIAIISIILLLTYNKTYDKYETYAIYDKENLKVDVNIANSDKILNGDFIKIDNFQLDYQIINISKIDDNFQTYTIKINKTYLENEVVKITFYSNKERIIKKIFRVIF